MRKNDSYKYGFLKPSLDAHTMGIYAAAELLRDCGYEAVFASESVAAAMSDYKYESQRKRIIDWLKSARIERLGISYRLDSADAVNMVGFLLEEIKKNNMLSHQGGPIDLIFFGGLPDTCNAIAREFNGMVITFGGGESVQETLRKMRVPQERIPTSMITSSSYDDFLLSFGKKVIDQEEYLNHEPANRSNYPEYGSRQDDVLKRLSANRSLPLEPLIRAHVGPYSSETDRFESVKEFLSWSKELAAANLLDILSIGSSQLTQSNFGEDWSGKINGGGVPINSPEEYRMIWQAARPLLLRTYAGTKDILQLAQMHEDTINICWHALSLWWFNQIDARGPYSLYANLKQHVATLAYIAKTNKPFEANVPHHFAFRGADDVTYIISAYLAAKLAKRQGIKTFILQNMLNTPRFTWGIQDLAKSRAMIKLVRSLEDQNFKVLLQPRAGLDYFKPDLYEARIQLAAVTALMDDIDPQNNRSPQIIHVVSFSEALHLATPAIINESIKITQHSLKEYRALRAAGKIEDTSNKIEIQARTESLYQSARQVIDAIENSLADPYSAEGFYKIFVAGFLPVPYLWHDAEEFKFAKAWRSKPHQGSVIIVDENDKLLKTERKIDLASSNLAQAEYFLKQQTPKNS